MARLCKYEKGILGQYFTHTFSELTEYSNISQLFVTFLKIAKNFHNS